ncbi:GABA transporter 1 isoform X2 [Dendrobium catenatum]|uniref:GABA transporter 1 isoform X2 n=1 Tax=Dendrobium catenatum TaxID=906689 RepID=UPI0010A00E4C|nr:GABA transporter 1 isoform X2 [Dendrobium catenatum]
MGEKKEEEEQNKNGQIPSQAPQLDAGALFVLQSKGSWLHCGYHLTTSIVAPALLSLPLALSALGEPSSAWPPAAPVQRYGSPDSRFYLGALLHWTNSVLSLLRCRCRQCSAWWTKHEGQSSDAPHRDYSLPSDEQDLVFGVFNAIAIIATSYGNGIIPEIQATVAPPVQGKMFKGLCLCYAVAVATFFSVAVSGYWVFGNLAKGTILSNFISGNGRPLVPKWFLLMANIFTILQLSAVAVVYLQPTNELLEGIFADPHKGQYSVRNVFPRIVFRSISVGMATAIAAMLPFFGDINAVIGAFGFLPLDFVVPAVLYNITFRPSMRGAVFWANVVIAVVFSVFAVLASIAAVRQILLDAKNYKLFANV